MDYVTLGIIVSGTTLVGSTFETIRRVAKDDIRNQDVCNAMAIFGCMSTAMVSFVALFVLSAYKLAWTPKLTFYTADGISGSLSLVEGNGRLVRQIPTDAVRIAIQHSHTIDDALLAELAKRCTKLDSLTIDSCTAVTGTTLGSFGTLRTLRLKNLYIPTEDIFLNLRGCVRLQELELNNLSFLGHEMTGLGDLVQLKRLKLLECEGLPSSLVGQIAQLTGLQQLWIRSCQNLSYTRARSLHYLLHNTTIFYNQHILPRLLAPSR